MAQFRPTEPKVMRVAEAEAALARARIPDPEVEDPEDLIAAAEEQLAAARWLEEIKLREGAQGNPGGRRYLWPSEPVAMSVEAADARLARTHALGPEVATRDLMIRAAEEQMWLSRTLEAERNERLPRADERVPNMTAIWPTQTGLISVAEAEARLAWARSLGPEIVNRDFIVRIEEARLRLARQRARHKLHDLQVITKRSDRVPVRPLR